MDAEDVNLVQAAMKGHREAFSMLVRNYQHYVFRTAYGILQNRTDAEDVTQETFIQMYSSLSAVRDARTFPSWLARIAVRKSLDWNSRKRGSQGTIPLQAEQVSIPDPHRSSDVLIDLEQALSRLPDEQRTVLVLREVQGFNYEELAEILDIPVGTVRSRLHNARTRLKSLLSTEGRDSR